MLVLKQYKNSKSKYEIYVDGKLCENSYAEDAYRSHDDYVMEYFSDTSNSSIKLAEQNISDFLPFEYIYLQDIFEWSEMANAVSIYQKTPRNLEIDLKFTPDLVEWKRDYSFGDYFTLLENERKKRDSVGNALEFDIEEGKFWLSFSAKISEISIKELIYPYEILLKEIFKTISKNINSQYEENNLKISFNFPESIKNHCEQYLVYFATFLHDLGIDATSNIKEEAGKVLFSVTPTDETQALDKIHEALAIYLSLASNPIPNSTSDRMVDMVLSGARANAKHLESQLELAIAKLQFKEATLELKASTIEQHQLALRQKNETIKELQEIVARGNIFEQSLERVEINGEVIEETSLYRFSREDDIELEATPILDENNEETRIGLVKFHEVTKLKDYGVTLDLPKAIRNLIDYFKRDKNND